MTTPAPPPGRPPGPPTAAPTGAVPDQRPAPLTAGGPPPGSAAPPGLATAPPSAWTAGRVVSLVVGVMLLVFSALVGLAAGAMAIGGAVLRDGDGYLMSGTTGLSTSTYALASTSVEIHTDAPGTVLPERLLGDAKVTARSTNGAPLFLGVAASSDVDRYLGGVAHATVVGMSGNGAQYRLSPGLRPRTPPTGRTFWVAQSTGTGERTITWPVHQGDWTVVVMNADGSASVRADVSAGATVPVVGWVTAVMAIGTGVGILLGLVLVLVPARRVAREHRAARSTTGG